MRTDRPEIVNSNLEAADIHYTLPSDSHLEAANVLYVAFHLDDATLAKQKQYRVNFDELTTAVEDADNGKI